MPRPTKLPSKILLRTRTATNRLLATTYGIDGRIERQKEEVVDQRGVWKKMDVFIYSNIYGIGRYCTVRKYKLFDEVALPHPNKLTLKKLKEIILADRAKQVDSKT